MIGNAPLSPITGVPGWETEAEQWHLLSLAKAVPDNGVIVEIGALYGMSASIFIYGTNLTHNIYSVDLFPDNLLQIHCNNLKEAGLAGRSIQYTGNSVNVAREYFGLGSIDLLFVDGDHSYEGVALDIAVWLSRVRSGGKVAFHDCACPTNKQPHALHFEVQRAVDEWATRATWRELPSVDTIRTFVKP